MWPPRNEAKALARVSRGKYQCAGCKTILGPKEVVLDHIVPVVQPETGWDGFGMFVESLFCPVEGFQVLCNPCHDVKTEKENELRKKIKNA